MVTGQTDLSLTLDFNPTVPANDNWANATTISGAFPQSFEANNCLGGPTSFDFLDPMIGIRSGTTSLATTNPEAGDNGCGPFTLSIAPGGTFMLDMGDWISPTPARRSRRSSP